MGRPRILVPVSSRSPLATRAPDLERLRAACDRLGMLGCYVHTTPTSTGRIAARMFAPSIRVAEDIANANSTACLAAHFAGRGITSIAVDMGDSLGNPATIAATTQHAPSATTVHLGGAAEGTYGFRLPQPRNGWRAAGRTDPVEPICEPAMKRNPDPDPFPPWSVSR
ncbi:hypothetical protein AV521_32120 [Streptomyces sp. IMTB 2501]|uniref:PhzF family phenazine biosynthesis protein n=1 Tax=Streptomyces sp. IMTB 2501 TaxID=1776340 RepID=UPI00096FED4C|nr:PhzF family phenazine biosynthesis protein [Streptomyces sp. IMTB 2501]OLZ65335.1 hypothetical protein AV521_32120 [Streptomyces sp. IMTB 2501]